MLSGAFIARSCGRTVQRCRSIASFVDGAYVVEGRDVGKVNPATGWVEYEVKHADAGTVHDAVQSAREAQKKWARLTGMERGRVMNRVATVLRERTIEIAALEVDDVGKPVAEAEAVDVASAADALEFFAGQAPTALEGTVHRGFTPAAAAIPFPGAATESADAHAQTFALSDRSPLGVCAGIGAWNYPVQIAAWKAAPALACGNAMVFKPSELAPRSALEVARAFADAGHPGLFNVVMGDEAVGKALCSHADIAKVSFTGSVPVGQAIVRQCADTLKRVTLELGGKSPFLVFADADLDQAVNGALMANFFTQGEVCTNGTRVLVEESVADEFCARVVRRARALRVGDPRAPDTQVGALISEAHMQRVLDFVAGARGEVLCGGERVEVPGRCVGGFFVSPAVVRSAPEGRLWDEEVFGPVMSVATFSGEADAVRLANSTRYGLAAGVFTESLRRAHRVSQQLDAGVVWVNNYNLAPVEVPFGGFRLSGQGKENGRQALHEYSKSKSVHFEMGGVVTDF